MVVSFRRLAPATCLAARHWAFAAASSTTLPTNSTASLWPPILVCPLLPAYTFATAPPDPDPPGQCAGSFRLLAEGRVLLDLFDIPASPTRTTPPKPKSRWPAHLPSLLRKRSQARWPSLPRGNVPAWTKPVAPPCSVLVHSISLDFAAPATMLVPARLCLCAESVFCREPRTQHGVTNHAAPATLHDPAAKSRLLHSLTWHSRTAQREAVGNHAGPCSPSQTYHTLCRIEIARS